MCGIVGWLAESSLGDPQQVAERLSRWRDTMPHRGPDDAGVMVSADGRVALGHRRLAILDLSPAGHQPMSTADGRLSIVFNGEIYNFLDLREELRQHGVTFQSASDTEVILHAYRHWGDACVSRLEGMFAFALYDAELDRVLLARDRAGEKPLYLHHSANGDLRFASELKALLADQALERRLSLESLDSYFTFGYIPGSQCVLQGFRKLPPAHTAVYSLSTGELREQRYWSLPELQPQAQSTDPQTLVDEFETLLESSVRRQLIADVPVGVTLSGGIDSSLVTALAAKVGGSKIRTFTITFAGYGAYDEGPFARIVARHFGTEHTELQAAPATVDLLPLLAKQYDEPLADSSMIPTFMVASLLRQQATVALGGDGGDELFGGYRLHQAIQANHRWRQYLPAWIRHPAAATARFCLPPELPGRQLLVRTLSDLPHDIASAGCLFDVRTRERLLKPLRQRLADFACNSEAIKYDLARLHPTALRMATGVDFATYLPDDILVKVDRATMLASLEMRAPFLDPRLIEFAFGRVPDHLRATAAGRKILPRMLASRLLPKELDLTRKQGFSIPLAVWLRSAAHGLASDVLANVDPTLFDRSFVSRLWRAHQAGRDLSAPLFAIIMFTLWQREYSVSAA